MENETTLLSRMEALVKAQEQLFDRKRQVAILWDVENVLPSTDSLFIDGFLDYIKDKYGRVSIAQAVANWSIPNVTKLGDLLSTNHFELIHVPKSRKNAADLVLVTHGVEIALRNPDLDTFVLVTGDADFKPLVQALRRNGKEVFIVCDVHHAAEDLLSMADDFIDYRELIPGGETEEETIQPVVVHQLQLTPPGPQSPLPVEKNPSKHLSSALEVLREAVLLMEQDKIKPGIGLVKVRMRMLAPWFDEKTLGYSNWSSFVEKAVDERVVKVVGSGAEAILTVDTGRLNESATPQQEGFQKLVKVLKRLDGNSSPSFHLFPQVNLELQKEEFSYKDLGYAQLKGFIQAAEARRLVTTKVNGLQHYVKLNG